MMSSLRYLTLDGNSLVGSLPTEIGHLTSLLELKLQNNHMNGTLPTEFGNLENIRVFRSERCTFTGTIPTEMGKLTRLEEWGKCLFVLVGIAFVIFVLTGDFSIFFRFTLGKVRRSPSGGNRKHDVASHDGFCGMATN
jgi:hypothetical protein